MTDSKPTMWYCQWHRLFHRPEAVCEGQKIIDDFEAGRKLGKVQPPIDFTKEVPLPQ